MQMHLTVSVEMAESDKLRFFCWKVGGEIHNFKWQGFFRFIWFQRSNVHQSHGHQPSSSGCWSITTTRKNPGKEGGETKINQLTLERKMYCNRGFKSKVTHVQGRFHQLDWHVCTSNVANQDCKFWSQIPQRDLKGWRSYNVSSHHIKAFHCKIHSSEAPQEKNNGGKEEANYILL